MRKLIVIPIVVCAMFAASSSTASAKGCGQYCRVMIMHTGTVKMVGPIKTYCTTRVKLWQKLHRVPGKVVLLPNTNASIGLDYPFMARVICKR